MTYTTLNYPFALSFGTTLTGINNADQITGFTSSGAVSHSFLYTGGMYVPVSDPLGINTTAALGLNDAGQIVGYYVGPGQQPGQSGGDIRGFVDSDGTYTTLDYPGASQPLRLINNKDQIVGNAQMQGGRNVGFIYSHGVFSTIADPLATAGTWALGINDKGQIVGYYQDVVGPGAQAFVDDGGTFTTLDPGGATQSVANAINARGEIVELFGL